MYYPNRVKKAFAIVLVLLILFNTVGFYGIFVGLKYKVKRDLIVRLDADDYEQGETLTIKIPISIPYNIDDTEFERIDGAFQHQGESFRLVKQKLTQDTLTIVCIRDTKTMGINQALADYVKMSTDKSAEGKTNGKLQVTFSKDFLPAVTTCMHACDGWSLNVSKLPPAVALTIDGVLTVAGPPPKI